MKRLFGATLQALSSVTLVVACTILLVTLIGCGNEPVREYSRHWSYEGNLAYAWVGPNQIVVKDGPNEVVIYRYMEEGEMGEVEWEWEDDGDIDIEYYGRDYDIDSPWDYDNAEEFEGYEELGGGFIAVWIGGKLVKKQKSWLKSNPKYNKKYTRTKTTVKNGVKTKTVVETSNKNGVAKAKVTKVQTDLKTGKQTVKVKQTVKKAAYKPKKKAYKPKKTSKRRK